MMVLLDFLFEFAISWMAWIEGLVFHSNGEDWKEEDGQGRIREICMRDKTLLRPRKSEDMHIWKLEKQ